MNKGLTIIICALVLCSVSFGDDERSPNAGDSPSTRALGDAILSFDASAVTGSEVLRGLEFANNHYWITAAGLAASSEPENYLFQVDVNGVLVNTFLQSTSTVQGWRDLAFDGLYLYGSDRNEIDQIDPATGQATGITIPSPVDPARGIAYDPVTDHFWVANFASDIYEIDRAGTILRTISNTHAIYGLAFDLYSLNGPFLWLWHQDDLADSAQIDLATGLETGNTFRGIVDGAAGGATVTVDLITGRLLFVGLEQNAAMDTIVVYDLDRLVVPTLTEWGLAILLGLMTFYGLKLIRRNREALAAPIAPGGSGR
jgi:hypothetical protein